MRFSGKGVSFRNFAGGAMGLPGNSHYVEGQIEESMMVSSGLGYANGDTGTVDVSDSSASLRAAPSDSARYRITGVDAQGRVTKYVITAKGSGYSAGSNKTTKGPSKPGVGTGFKISITRLS